MSYIHSDLPIGIVDIYIDRFLRKQGSPIGLEGRIARKFGLIYAAGKIANQHARLLGWNFRLPLQAVSTLYKRSMAHRLGEPAYPESLTTFAQLIDDSKLVRRAQLGRTLCAKRERDLLAIRCRQDGRRVIGLRLAALREHLPSEHQFVESWLQSTGVARRGHGGRRTCQVPVRVMIGDKTNDKPRLLLLRPKRLRSALLKAGVV